MLFNPVSQVHQAHQGQGERGIRHQPDMQREGKDVGPGDRAQAAGSEAADVAVAAEVRRIGAHTLDGRAERGHIVRGMASALAAGHQCLAIHGQQGGSLKTVMGCLVHKRPVWV